MFSESKICFVLVLLLMCPIIFKIDYILDLWLGVVPPQTNIFAILVLTDALICTLNTPCSQVVFATGNLKYYQIASSAINLCLLPVCFVMLLSGFNAASVFITTIVFSILNQTVCVRQAHRVFAFSVVDYIKKIILPCSLIMVLLPSILFPIAHTLPDSFVSLLIIIFADVIIGMVVAYFLVFERNEKALVCQLVSKIIKRH